jgi:hypothetical protein
VSSARSCEEEESGKMGVAESETGMYGEKMVSAGNPYEYRRFTIF